MARGVRYNCRMLRAIVFDFDGVIADTEPLHLRAFEQVLAGQVPVPSHEDYFRRYVGLTDAAFLAALFREVGRPLNAETRQQLLDRKCRVYREMIESGLALLPGLEVFVRRVATRWPLAICSGALRSEIEYVLRPTGLLPLFSVLVSSDCVATSKPDPEGYLLACRLLSEKTPGLRPEECLAIEDSGHGIAAAKAAGMRVLAVRSVHGGVIGNTDGEISDYHDLNESDLQRLFA